MTWIKKGGFNSLISKFMKHNEEEQKESESEESGGNG